MKLVGPEVLAAVSPARLRSLKFLCVTSVVAPAIVFSAYAYITYDAAHRAAEAKALHLVGMLQDHTQRVFETIQLALYHTDRLLAGRRSGSVLRRDPAAGRRLGRPDAGGRAPGGRGAEA